MNAFILISILCGIAGVLIAGIFIKFIINKEKEKI